MRLRYIGDSVGAVPGMPAWQPGEVRDLAPDQAALLVHHALWREAVTPSAARQQEAADAKGAPVSSTTEEVS